MKAENLLLLCLLVAALGFAGGVVTAPDSTQAEEPTQIAETSPESTESSDLGGTSSFLADAPRLGKKTAPVVLLVVSDFQCPVCRRAAEPMEEIQQHFKEDLVIYFIQNPLKMHKNAMIAAQASMAAHKQGAFWAFHDRLFANQARLTFVHQEGHARALNLDLAQFAADRADPAIKDLIDRQSGAVSELGARGTPSFFINGKKTIGWGSQIGIEGQIKKEVEASKAILAQGKTISEVYEARVYLNSEKPELYLQHFGR